MVKTEIYEEYLVNSYPSPCTLYDSGFVLRFGGIDLLTNSVFPLYEKNDKYLPQKVAEIERLLKGYDLPVIYRTTASKTYQRLDRHLVSKGYDKISTHLVMRCILKGKKAELFRFADFNENGVFTDEISDDLLKEYFYLKNYDDQAGYIFSKSMDLCPLPKYVLTLIEENTLIGQAICVKQDDVVSILDIVINEKLRGSGYAERLLLSVLTYAIRINAQLVIADVPVKNEAAMHTFAKIKMFEPVYEAYYRKN